MGRLRRSGADQISAATSETEPKEPAADPFNMIRPNRIQIIGPPKEAHIKSLEKSDHQDCLNQLFDTRPRRPWP